MLSLCCLLNAWLSAVLLNIFVTFFHSFFLFILFFNFIFKSVPLLITYIHFHSVSSSHYLQNLHCFLYHFDSLNSQQKIKSLLLPYLHCIMFCCLICTYNVQKLTGQFLIIFSINNVSCEKCRCMYGFSLC